MASSESGLRTRTRGSKRAVLAFGLALMTGVLAAAEPTGGAGLRLDRYRGSVVIVDFWASWCKPCRQSIPWLNELRTRYGARGLVVIGVNVDAVRGDADRFQRDVPIDFEIVYDPTGDLAKAFKVQGMPSSYVFDRRGDLVETHLGFRDAKRGEHEASLEKFLSQSAQ